MLTVEELTSLEVGDEIITDAFIKGLTDEPLKLTVSNVATDPNLKVSFAVTYFDISVGTWSCELQQASMFWKLS